MWESIHKESKSTSKRGEKKEVCLALKNPMYWEKALGSNTSRSRSQGWEGRKTCEEI